MGRDGKKGRGGGRGGRGKMYIDNIDELRIRDATFEEQRAARAKRREEDDDDDDEEDGKGGGDAVEEEGGADSVFTFDRSSSKKKAAGGVGGEDGGGEEEESGGAGAKPKSALLGGIATENPNLLKKMAQPRQLKVKDLDGAAPADPDAGMNRKEREVMETQRKKEDYIRRHLAGETVEAKKEMAMLAIVKARREEAARKREVEGRKPGMSTTGLPEEDDDSDDDDSDDDEDGDEKQKTTKKPAAAPALSEIAKKKKAAAAGEEVATKDTKSAAGGKPGEPPKLKAMEIKKMNPDALKENLRERGLDVQGPKKDIMQRLLDFEAARA